HHGGQTRLHVVGTASVNIGAVMYRMQTGTAFIAVQRHGVEVAVQHQAAPATGAAVRGQYRRSRGRPDASAPESARTQPLGDVASNAAFAGRAGHETRVGRVDRDEL